MPLRKLKECPIERCFHPDHEPPKFVSLSPGLYEHTCPACGKKTVFSVSGVYMSDKLRILPGWETGKYRPW